MNGENHVLTRDAAITATHLSGYYLERRRPRARTWKHFKTNPDTYGIGWRMWYAMPTPSDRVATPWITSRNAERMKGVYGCE